jgi:hypothetical protein
MARCARAQCKRVFKRSSRRVRYCSTRCAGLAKRTDRREAFKRKYIRGKPDECWEWLGRINDDGYGGFYAGYVRGKPTNTSAHRFAYEMAKGRVPRGLCVLHSCDNRRCVNPAHLRAGTKLDNAQDMISRGRDDYGGRKLAQYLRHALNCADLDGDCPTCREAAQYLERRKA